MKDDKILIVGFSGAGKTYLLAQLEAMGKTADDLDQIVIKQGQFSNTREMIKVIGLQTFRELEFKMLQNWLRDSTANYLALGGGGVTNESISMINQYSGLEVIYINKKFSDCWDGLKRRGNSYLIDLGESKARELYVERRNLYTQLRGLVEYKTADDYLSCLN